MWSTGGSEIVGVDSDAVGSGLVSSDAVDFGKVDSGIVGSGFSALAQDASSVRTNANIVRREKHAS